MAREIGRGDPKRWRTWSPPTISADYEVKEREPVRGSYRGYEVISAPPPSSGGTALIEILNILEGYDLAEAGQPLSRIDPSDGRGLPAAFFDRAEFLGDSGFLEDSRSRN